jgi:hypothetical protein
MSSDPGTRNGAGHAPSTTDYDRELNCYECDAEYTYLGAGDHPGRCPACESRAVSFAGDPRAVAPREGLADGSARRLAPLFKVTVGDATDRQFEYFVAYAGDDTDGRALPVLRYVRVGDYRIHPTTEEWDDELVPRCLLHVVRELTDSGLMIPSDDASDRDDDDDGGIDVGHGY